MRLIAWMSEPRARSLAERFPNAELVAVGSASELVAAVRQAHSIAVVDGAALAALGDRPGPLILITDEPLKDVVRWLSAKGWLDHVVSASMLDHPHVGEHLQNVFSTLAKATTPRLLDWIDESVAGRRVRLVQASRRLERLDKISEFYETNGVGPRTVQVLRDAAEELLTNAFYDAPVAAKIVGEAISRTRDVCLPDDFACDLSYGCNDDFAFVRVSDPFGSLSRARLVEVLTRCSRSDMQVSVDESMGGAGLGLWRIFSGASLVGISVVEERKTEILVGVWKRVGAARPFCIHLFFEGGHSSRRWKLGADSVTTSVTLVNE